MKLTVIIFIAMCVVSCGKSEDSKSESQANQDTVELEKDEMFGYALVNELLETEDEILETFLTTQIYPLASNAKKVSMERMSNTVYYLSLYNEKDTSEIWIKKFYDPQNEEIFFEKYDKPVN